MIIIDGREFKYVKFPDGTYDYFHDSCGKISNITWVYDGDLSEVFVCLTLLRNNFVNVFQFFFLPFARQDKLSDGFSGLYSFLTLFEPFKNTKFIVEDAHNPEALPASWVNSCQAFVTPDDGKSIVVFPDEGALHKYSNHYQHIPFIGAVKKRDLKTGEIFELTLPCEIPRTVETIYVIDDICDGGKTFVELASILPKDRVLGLFTTYGIYSKGKQVLYDAGYSLVKCQFNIFGVEE